MLLALLAAFCLGAIYDIAALFWMQATRERYPAGATFMSMWLGAAQVLGIGTALHSTPEMVALVLGYGVGTWLSVKYL